MAKQLPDVGQWYQDAAEDLIFEVILVDEETATVEVQYQSGEVSGIDFESWYQMVLLPAEAPEDWRASYELSDDDGTDPDSVYMPGMWNDPLTSIESDSLYGLDDY